jgi:hypothetical protein
MAVAPDDDARRTLAKLEAKLRELERELLRGHEPEPAPAEPFAAPAEEPVEERRVAWRPREREPQPEAPAAFTAGDWIVSAPPEDEGPEPVARAEPALEPEPVLEAEAEPEPVATLDPDALSAARGLVATLRTTIEDMGPTAERITTQAHAVADDHGRTLGRLARAAQAAARAEQAALEAGRLAATVVVEAGPFADAGAVTALRDALAAQPGARDAYVRGVEDGRAVIEVHLTPPPA